MGGNSDSPEQGSVFIHNAVPEKNHMKILLYTLSTFPDIQSLSRFQPFIFKKLKTDFQNFTRHILKTKPTLIIGVARSANSSHFEIKAVNRFNRNKKINAYGIAEYPLTYPSQGFGKIGVSSRFTDTFCNWTMYKISEFINSSSIGLQFVHIHPRDISDLISYLSQINNEKEFRVNTRDSVN